MRISLVTRFLLCAALPLLLAACAKTPTTDTAATNSRLIDVSMTLRGAINPNYYYFVLLNRTNAISDSGPVPVVAPPWGNGFAAAGPQSDAQGFVACVVFRNNNFEVFKVPTDANNIPVAKPYNLGTGTTGFVSLGQPDQYTTPATGDHTLRFRLDLSRLPNPTARYLAVNLLATNNLPAGVDPAAPKLWDALGNGAATGEINSFFVLDVTQSQRRDNATATTPEPANDVRDHLGAIVDEPSLDITDYSVQVLSK